jgi:hypothetical protein
VFVDENDYPTVKSLGAESFCDDENGFVEESVT